MSNFFKKLTKYAKELTKKGGLSNFDKVVENKTKRYIQDITGNKYDDKDQTSENFQPDDSDKNFEDYHNDMINKKQGIPFMVGLTFLYNLRLDHS